MAGIGTITLSRRERIVMVEPRGRRIDADHFTRCEWGAACPVRGPDGPRWSRGNCC